MSQLLFSALALVIFGGQRSPDAEPSLAPLEVAPIGGGLYAGLLEGTGLTQPPARSRDELRELVREALQSSYGKDVRFDIAVPLLAYAYGQVERDKELSAADRETLRIQLRSRLLTMGDRIFEAARDARLAQERAEARVKRDKYLATLREKKSAAAAKKGEKAAGDTEETDNDTAGSRFPAGRAGAKGDDRKPGAPGGGAEEEGEALVELIRRTVAPDTWDVNGGPGSIVYYKPLKVLVVRQTGEIHWLIGGLRQALEK